jgi:serine/threonine protein kinase
MATRVGTQLGRYEIDAEIGRGAMGVVYRGRDPKIGRIVAIKTVSLSGLEPDAEQEYRERFAVEAQAAGRLSHAGIVTIFDVGEESETRAPYLVMEYIEGQSLHKLLSGEGGRLPLSTALGLAQELAEALHCAHEQGVVHRDIKPANILIDADGHAHIADFGIAKLNQAHLTVPGQVLGSPAYMAPEQLSDEAVDARSDLFSLGVILYSMLTGHRPFQGNSTTTVCFKLVNHQPLAVTAFNADFPPELDQIVSRAIAKDPAQRYQSGMGMAADIRRLRESCGLVQGTGDWTARSLTRDAIPRYITGCGEQRPHERGPSAQDLEPTDRLSTNSGPAIAGEKIAVQRGLWRPWSSVVIAILLAAATGFLAFSTIHRGAPQLSQQITMDPAVEDSKSSGNSHAGRHEKQMMPKGLAARATVPASVAKIPVPTIPATLQIEIEHHFTDALASVWLDNHLVYRHALHADTRRHALIFRKVEGREFEAIRVATGKHEVRVRIQSAAGGYDESKTIAAAFTRSSDSRLRIVCGKKRGALQLTVQ